MVRQLLMDTLQYLNNIQDPTEEEKRLINRIKGELPYFIISRVHRDDLAAKGYDTSRVDDFTMERLGEKLGSDYTDQLFWCSLPIIADHLEIPKNEKMHCPQCGSPNTEFEIQEHVFFCESCNHEWQEQVTEN